MDTLPTEVRSLIVDQLDDVSLMMWHMVCGTTPTIKHKYLIYTAAKNGYLKLIIFLRRLGYPYSRHDAVFAASNGHLNVIKYLHRHGYVFDDWVTYTAVAQGHLHIVKYIRCSKLPYPADLAASAASSDSIPMLNYVHNPKHISDTQVCMNVDDNLDMLKLTRALGYQWDSNMYFMAAIRGNVNILEWIYNNGCPIDLDVNYVNGAARNGHLDSVIWLIDHGFLICDQDNAAIGGNLELFQYVCDRTNRGLLVCDNAAAYGHLNILQYAYENGYQLTSSTGVQAASNGHVHILQFLHRIGYLFSGDMMYEAAFNGHIQTIKYLREMGREWNVNMCAGAASNDNPECLQWLHDNGCPWDANTAGEAMCNKHKNCFMYAINNGCPIDDDVREIMQEDNWMNVFD